MLTSLTREDRLRLMKFVCSFAWADLQVKSEERAFIAKLIQALELNEEEAGQVKHWLELPPRPEEIDPNDIPPAHRQLFLDSIEAVVAADAAISPDERENLTLLRQLIAD
jgi:hypothetical protein